MDEKILRSYIRKFLLKEHTNSLPEEVDAFHGTPHKFKKFTMDNLGGGEGNHSFGWGLYFTDVEKIANHYADVLAPRTLYIGDKSIEELTNFKHPNPAYRWIWHYTIDDKLNKQQILEKLYKMLLDTNWLKNNPTMENYIKEIIPVLEKNKIKVVRDPSFIYKVKLHGGKKINEYNWLEWDKPISKHHLEIALNILRQQEDNSSAKVFQRNLSQALVNNEFTNMPKTGEALYDKLANILGKKETSLSLLKNGIDGIKYPTDFHGSNPTLYDEQGYNYVIFDANAVSVEKVKKFKAR